MPGIGPSRSAGTPARDAMHAGLAPRVLVTYGAGAMAGPGHEAGSRDAIARRLAAVKGCEFAGEYDAAAHYPGKPYFVPGDTVVGVKRARMLGIRGEEDLFGGVVPSAFVGTKAISHPLVAPDARAPRGWSALFGRRVCDLVLQGFSAFSRRDALHAGRKLLEEGPVRIKRAQGTGGRGQMVVANAAELEAWLDGIGAVELARQGVVLEQDLDEVTTYSVGQVRFPPLTISYWGMQRTTRANDGATVYGGSDLIVARGDFDTLLQLDMPAAARQAIVQARAYDAAARLCFSGFCASRRNYDVAQGIDARGRSRSGVLEQSWRAGGASSAEVAALEAFSAEPGLRLVRASCCETYGAGAKVPSNASVYFSGHDERVGLITKYAWAEPYADA